MQDVIWDWVFPRLNVEIRSHSVPDRKGQLWTVYVKRQRERDMPFIVAKEFLRDQGSSRNLFSMYERSGSHNRPYSPQQVHGWIHRGWSGLTEEPPAPVAPPTDETDSVLGGELEAIGADPRASSYYLQAMPLNPTQLQNFYRGARNSLHDTLFKIPQLRPAGFNLPDGLLPDRTGSGALRVVWRQSDSLSVTPEGIATAIQGQEPLTWAYTNVAPREEYWINPLALVEFTLEFWRFYVGQVQTRMDASQATVWRAGMKGLLDPEPLYLPMEFTHGSDREPAKADSFDFEWSRTDERDPGSLAFIVLSRVYSQFGLAKELIPYAEGRRISEQAIVNVKRGA